jgi:hypothetical protein
MTSDIIGTAMAGETVTATTKVGRGRKAVEVKVTRTAPEAKVLVEALLAEVEGLTTYDEANGTVPF